MRNRALPLLCAACGLAAILSLASAPARAAAPQPECAAADAWVNAHRSELPTSYEALGKYSAEYRRAIVAALDPGSQSQLWRTQFERSLAAADLTAEQRGILREAIELASPDFFAKPDLEEISHLMVRAIQAFGAERANQIFVELGSAAPGAVVVTPACPCATAPGDTCGTNKYCDDTAVCNPSSRGCGPGGVYACNGMCANNVKITQQ